jgi:hypothetical protein
MLKIGDQAWWLVLALCLVYRYATTESVRIDRLIGATPAEVQVLRVDTCG